MNNKILDGSQAGIEAHQPWPAKEAGAEQATRNGPMTKFRQAIVDAQAELEKAAVSLREGLSFRKECGFPSQDWAWENTITVYTDAAHMLKSALAIPDEEMANAARLAHCWNCHDEFVRFTASVQEWFALRNIQGGTAPALLAKATELLEKARTP